jgi:2',3'-cyclic-nucleotide 2'-phosphodiesterase / 3'-nucleotidase / 5'-nucleotidase
MRTSTALLSLAGLCVAALPVVAAGSPKPKVILEPLGSYRERVIVDGTEVCRKRLAEIAAYDPRSRRLFVANAADAALDILDVSDPRAPKQLKRVRLADLVHSSNFTPTSVAAADGRVALVIEAVEPITAPGQLLLLDTAGRLLRSFPVGSGPDMVAFTPDGRRVLAAIEGEPDQGYQVDPEGEIALVDLTAGVAHAILTRIRFTPFNARLAELRARGVRIYGPGATVAQDLEPEYLAVSDHSRTAWVTLQENNALAVVDLAEARVVDIVGLGLKDHARFRNGLDASDQDDRINIQPWPAFGLYQPDAIAFLKTPGRRYLVTANEGDAREYDAFNELAPVGDLTLDPAKFADPDLQADERLGRLEASTVGADPDGDGDVDRLLPIGGRSLSVWDEAGHLVYDTGDLLERATAADALYAPAANLFNTSDDENEFDGRSEKRGPEPEGVAIGRVAGHTYAFLATERTSVIATFDVTDPRSVAFQGLAGTRNFAEDPKAVGSADEDDYVNCAAGDLGPEGVLFLPKDESPIGTALLVVSYETSGSVRLFAVKPIAR